LIGLIHKGESRYKPNDLQEMDLREMGHSISQHGLSDLPWQLSGETIAQTPPAPIAKDRHMP